MQGVFLRGVRGAIDVPANEAGQVLEATRELLLEMLKSNSLQEGDIAAIFFTATADLDAVFPAEAARQLGWNSVPLLCAREIDVPGSLPKCVRVLMLVNSSKTAEEIRHIYLRGASVLREELNSEEDG